MQLTDLNPVLKAMYETGQAVNQEGAAALHSNLPKAYAEALFGVVTRERPLVALEVGMAFGTSALAILTAMKESGHGRLISIDPAQTSGWNNSGVAAVAKAGLSGLHELIEDYDYKALPKLLDAGTAVDFAYIDGWHTFDYTLLDWWYIDRMLPVGGVVAFNDCNWPAVDRAIRFMLSHRRYAEIDVGLPVTLSRKESLTKRIGRMLTGEPDQRRRTEDRYFRKIEDWEPSWDFYAPF